MKLLWILFVLQRIAVIVCAKGPLICVHGRKNLSDGLVHLNGTLSSGGLEYPRNTWRQRPNGSFEVCKCVVKPCFRKCCSEGQGHYSINFRECRNASVLHRNVSTIRPSVHQEDDLLTTVIEENDTHSFYDHFDVVYGKPCPGKMMRPDIDELGEFHLLKDGRLRAWGGGEILDVFAYCFEVLLDAGKIMPILCVTDSEPVKFTIYAVGMMISVPFLAATFIIYAMLPVLHTFHGRSLMSHNLALLIAFISVPVSYAVHKKVPAMCMMCAFIIYFAFLASFFWLNVMCLDIWWTFSGFRPMRGSVKEREHKKFIIYSLYCWGSPLIMLIICMIMDLHPGIPDTYEKPRFGELKCWFRSDIGNLIYFSGPIGILIVCNIVLFILTAVKIRQVKRGTKILKKQDSRRHNEEEENNAQRFNLYLKLFLVMGVNWIMEIVSFAAGGPDEYWYITDIANTLQGVLIFIIFVWKDRIRKLLMERFCPGRAANTNSIANSSSTRTTGIRHNGSVMSSGRPSLRANREDYQMTTLTTPSGRSDDSDIA